jgi:hypothetical protein
MIDLVLASEFDIYKGCIIKHYFPTYFEINDTILASYMIPDGVHKWEIDLCAF